jgi:thiol-disulfide isomerase/thioredoxin
MRSTRVTVLLPLLTLLAIPAVGAAASPPPVKPTGKQEGATAVPPPLLAAPAPTASTVPPGWRRMSAPLPTFDLTDLDGKRWRLEELRGRKLYVIGWATWCGYCRIQLPLVDELAKRLVGRDDVAVLTLNVDADPAEVAPYMSERGFGFPSLFAGDWYPRVDRDGSVPHGWIVDGEGVARYEQDGFSRALAPRWVDDVVALLDALPAAAPASGS